MRERKKMSMINRGFVVFLTVVCVVVMFSAVNYLRMKQQLTQLIDDKGELESRLSTLKEENNTRQSQLNASVDLNAVKKEAMERLGMQYPTEDQIRIYETSRGSFVRQYQGVPDE